jgi:hypothetical protein|tara:strand:- start:602 stop:847 length:246 start_codon:yes stop_codon:yes gene_type:complete
MHKATVTLNAAQIAILANHIRVTDEALSAADDMVRSAYARGRPYKKGKADILRETYRNARLHALASREYLKSLVEVCGNGS